jgi:hypothetical protein
MMKGGTSTSLSKKFIEKEINLFICKKVDALIEEAALKSYTGSQAIQAATWPIIVAFPEYFKCEMNWERVDTKSLTSSLASSGKT